MTRFFKGFRHGFKSNTIIWFAYEVSANQFESIFRLEDVTSVDHNRILFEHIIKPCLLPFNFFGSQSPSYEFYNPSSSAHQLGFGQLPIGLYFKDLIKPKEIIPNGVYFDRLKNLNPDSSTVVLDGWNNFHFTSPAFKTWWSEWSE